MAGEIGEEEIEGNAERLRERDGGRPVLSDVLKRASLGYKVRHLVQSALSPVIPNLLLLPFRVAKAGVESVLYYVFR